MSAWRVQFLPRYWRVFWHATWGFTEADGSYRVLMHLRQLGPFRLVKWVGPS